MERRRRGPYGPIARLVDIITSPDAARCDNSPVLQPLRLSHSLPAFVLVVIAACGGSTIGISGSGSGPGASGGGVSTGAGTGTISGTVSVVASGATRGAITSGSASGAGMSGGSGSSSATSNGAAACTTPTFTPQGGTVAAGTAVTLTASGLPANGLIYYTTDQTMPTHESTFVASGGTVTVSQSETITAIAYAMGACADSEIAIATYSVADVDGDMGSPPACAAPTFMPGAGMVALGSTITILPPVGFPATFPQGNGTIYYAVDGTIPTHASPAYSGPIQINAAETIRAIASYPGVCTDSTVALANFTVTVVEVGGLPPAFNPPSTTQANDFLVQLTDFNPAATICFTYGANNPPTCTVTATSATCSGTSQMYNAGAGLGETGSVTINGSVTTAAGTVVVNAIVCQPGNVTSAVTSQTYTLQAAAPTMQGPAPSPTLPYQSGGYMPTLSSTTAGSTLNYTTDGSTPTCASGVLDAGIPVTEPTMTVPTMANTTYNAVACKTGYAPSEQATFAYGIVLPPPGFVDSASTTTTEGTGTYDGVLSIDFSGPPTPMGASQASGLFVCYTTDGSAPSCGTTAGSCSQGTSDNVVGSMPTAVSIAATGTSINSVACSPSYNSSAVATATYTLQLDAAVDATTE
jgi:hypothetical protein